ncbi:hypothetical protein [Herbiconiux sp. L3-i23]|uniref:hypothetical protein n=1 Tax=Herbiconiux sp. L3-i23 TaxID=2905871 RepID=UPI002070DF3B|nr:hypothetical protein [Herbiconiux sp. L3-i23]BDI21517.1 hypothetical protein L3i23_02930 [Herbiconiux sp. L3-i23]
MNGTRTLQRADPLGALAGRQLILAAAVAVAGFAIVLTIASGERIVNWPLAVVAVMLAGVAACYLVVLTHPRFGALGRTVTVAVLLFGMAAHLVEVVSVWGSAPGVTMWGPYTSALLLLALVPYRPIAEIVVGTVVVAIWVVALTAIQETVSETPVVPGLPTLIAVTPVLALPAGGAAFVHRVLGFLDRWRAGALAASEAEARRQETAITRAVQQTRVSILNRDVVPFYSGLVERGAIADDDIARAGRLAGSLRAVMLADTERSWLDELITPQRFADGAVVPSRVDDRDGLAGAMDLDQRTALRALIGAVRDLPGGRTETIRVVIDEAGGVCETVLVGALRGASSRDARLLRPYLAVMAAVFADFSYDFRDDEMTVRFCYDRP